MWQYSVPAAEPFLKKSLMAPSACAEGLVSPSQSRKTAHGGVVESYGRERVCKMKCKCCADQSLCCSFSGQPLQRQGGTGVPGACVCGRTATRGWHRKKSYLHAH